MGTSLTLRPKPSAWLLLTLLTGCYSTATLHTARPVGTDAVQGAVALGSFLGEEDGDITALPTIEGQVRLGVSERLDVGLHITSLGSLALDANYAILLNEQQAISVDPTVEFTLGTYAWLPVLWDFYQTDKVTLTAALRGGRYWVDSEGEDESFVLDPLEADVWLYGFGLSGQIRMNDSLSLAPEVRLIWPDREGEPRADPLLSASFGLVF